MDDWQKKGILKLKEKPGEQGYILQTVKNAGRRTLLIAGTDLAGYFMEYMVCLRIIWECVFI